MRCHGNSNVKYDVKYNVKHVLFLFFSPIDLALYFPDQIMADRVLNV